MTVDLVNVAPFGKASQSSLSPLSHPEGAQALVMPGDQDFAIHTDVEDGPWWRLDLPWPVPLVRITIANRSDRSYRSRARRLCVEISQDGVEWVVVHAGYRFFGDGKDSVPLRIELGRQITARHVRLSLPEREALNLRQIELLVHPGDFALVSAWHTLGLEFHRSSDIRSAPAPSYSVEGDGDDGNTGITGFRIRTGGRLGNAVIQLIHAIHLAEKRGIGVIEAPDVRIGAGNVRVERNGIALLPSGEHGPPGNYLKGDFFYKKSLSATAFADLNGAETRRIAQDYVMPFFGLGPLDPARINARSRELAVHVRSGDIFSDNPHPAYVQPPLAFYRKVIANLLDLKLVDRVCIVAEDRRNPCIGALEGYLTSIGIPVTMQTGTLAEDVDYLRHARHVVYGFGTFGYGVSVLGGQIKTLSYFSEMPLAYGALPNVESVYSYRSAPGTYIKAGEWTRSPDQLRLMLEFPEDKIVKVR